MASWVQGGDGGVIQVVMRHGARGPSNGALKPFLGTSVQHAWDPEDLERLTLVGKAQCTALGEALGCELLQMKGGKIKVRWHSSKVERVLDSGRCFLQGLARSGAIDEDERKVLCTKPTHLGPEGQDPDLYFRNYQYDQEYEAVSKDLRQGEVFQARGEEFRHVLGKISPPLNTKSLAEKLNETTHVEELLECENFWPTTGERVALHSQNDAATLASAAQLARWCWDQRFFKLARARELGLPLLQEIQKAATSSEEKSDLVFYSAHDYTIMSLLVALGAESYPEQTLGYSSYIVFYGDALATANIRPFFSKESTEPNKEHELRFEKPFAKKASGV